MDLITHDAGVQEALTALLGDRLSIIAGAGLSMAPPSSLPSAALLAAQAKAKYAATYGATRPPLPDLIEQQADSGHWYRCYGNENWEFNDQGFMMRRFASINDLPI